MSSDNIRLSVSQLARVLSPSLTDAILLRAQTEEKKTFAAFMSVVGAALKFRPGIWQKWPKAQQREWLWTNLRSPRFTDSARQLMQEWFFAERTAMLTRFLDSLGVGHDEKGFISDELPDAFDAAKVREGTAALEKDFPAEEIALYLYLFQLGKEGGWTEIAAEIERLAPATWQWRTEPSAAG
ncbi:MAG: hypothetical protein LBT53_01955 [Puniceicoccales bacterium]|nr:hypothetical protein [Puniceicoccales bacterium]